METKEESVKWKRKCELAQVELQEATTLLQ